MTKTSTYFECKVQSLKTLENGKVKKVTDQYVVEAFTFTEAETSINKEISAYYADGFSVIGEKIAPYTEVTTSDKAEDDKWYIAKVAFVTLDERTGKEKKQTFRYLIQAADSNTAMDYTHDLFRDSMLDYTVVAIIETPFLDVFFHDTIG